MTPLVNFDHLFNGNRVMVILRGCPIDEAVLLANVAWDIGVQIVEVPLNTGTQQTTLRAVVKEGVNRGKVVGAGTTIRPEDVHAAVSAGAQYTVAPGFDPEVLAASLSAGLPHLPGIATPTELQRACRAGCRWVKVFPASTLGPSWVKAIRGPFPHVRQVVTGGIEIATAHKYLTAGAQVVAFGARALQQRDDLEQLARDTRTLADL